MKPNGGVASQIPVLETIVKKGVRRELERRHWRVIRNNVTKVQFRAGVWTQFGEPGMPDLLAIQYLNSDGLAVVLWIETKRPFGGRLGDDQISWRKHECDRGAVVMVVSDVTQFLAEYEEHLGWIHRPPYSVPGDQFTLNLDACGE